MISCVVHFKPKHFASLLPVNRQRADKANPVVEMNLPTPDQSSQDIYASPPTSWFNTLSIPSSLLPHFLYTSENMRSHLGIGKLLSGQHAVSIE